MSDKKAKYHTVLLDADETLLDFSKAQRIALKNTLEESGFLWNEEINALYSDENLKVWKKYERAEITKERLKLERFENFFAILGYNHVNVCKVNAAYVKHLSRCGFTLSGATDLCRALYGTCKLYIATNGIRAVQEGRLSKSKIRPYIDGMFISDVIGSQKPAKEYFDAIFSALKITDRSGIILLGDSLTSDMQGGKNAGITTCLFDPQDKTPLPNALCDYKITNLMDFVPLVLF